MMAIFKSEYTSKKYPAFAKAAREAFIAAKTRKEDQEKAEAQAKAASRRSWGFWGWDQIV